MAVKVWPDPASSTHSYMSTQAHRHKTHHMHPCTAIRQFGTSVLGRGAKIIPVKVELLLPGSILFPHWQFSSFIPVELGGTDVVSSSAQLLCATYRVRPVVMICGGKHWPVRLSPSSQRCQYGLKSLSEMRGIIGLYVPHSIRMEPHTIVSVSSFFLMTLVSLCVCLWLST